MFWHFIIGIIILYVIYRLCGTLVFPRIAKRRQQKFQEKFLKENPQIRKTRDEKQDSRYFSNNNSKQLPMSISENLKKIRSTLPESVTLIAVSKTKPIPALQEAYDAGQRVFGENKALEMRDKHEALPKDIEWHFIGHLQTNKIKYIAPYVSLIHSVDSLNLLSEINKEAAKRERTIDCLLQFHIASEETKFGLDLGEAEEMLLSPTFKTLENVNIVGVMGMATNTNDTELIHKEFRNLKSIFDTLKEKHFAGKSDFRQISMGMSGDYPIAVEEGSTLVRVGSAIFGARDYGVPVNDK